MIKGTKRGANKGGPHAEERGGNEVASYTKKLSGGGGTGNKSLGGHLDKGSSVIVCEKRRERKGGKNKNTVGIDEGDGS